MPLSQVRDVFLMCLRRPVVGKSDSLENILVSSFPVSHERGLDTPTITVQRGTDTVEEHLNQYQQTT